MIDERGAAEVMREEIDAASEFVFLRLRLEAGVDLTEYEARYGQELAATHGSEIEELVENELLTLEGNYLKLTRRGKLFSNEVFAAFV